MPIGGSTQDGNQEIKIRKTRYFHFTLAAQNLVLMIFRVGGGGYEGRMLKMLFDPHFNCIKKYSLFACVVLLTTNRIKLGYLYI